ncbi:MAG: MerR family transcriptional regulator [Agathobaculum sp.]|jgi:DNA-binding transcriptional MerR regulator|uniref:MerR family transcriptional regulator n=1 Tax=Agathobaculum sp. TaxID=2048138 RepID=UPI003D94BE49
MYTIGQVSEMFQLPISTLRYYDKQGLFPQIRRVSGIRKFSDTEIEALRVIECLKKSGLEIKDIKQFMDWCAEGKATYPQRKALFEKQRKNLEAEITRLNKVLDMLKFKCWYYEQAMQDGGEERLSKMLPNHLPDEIRPAYENAHKA